MYLIGLTGGIASGKSVVAKRLAELGAVHIDADLIAREVVEPGTPSLAAIREAFGPDILTPEGTLDRPALGAIIFTDAQARGVLNDIIHPAIKARVVEIARETDAADPHAIVLYDVPLLVEGGGRSTLKLDMIAVVAAAAETRIARMIENRGLTREEAMHRINSQATDAQRLAVADVVIDNNGTLEHVIEQTDALWARAQAVAG